LGVEAAQRLLAEAGYPEGKGLSDLILAHFIMPCYQQMAEKITRQWREALDVDAQIVAIPRPGVEHLSPETALVLGGWRADYLDPDSMFLNGQDRWLRDSGWVNDRYEELIRTAAQTPDRAARLSMYRQADRLLVADEFLVLPLAYVVNLYNLVQPWVRNLRRNALGFYDLREVILEDRPGEG
jgi:oligopeptide transport system substrate-binding protein